MQANHPGANGGKDAYPGGGVGDRLIADQAGYVLAVEQDAILFLAGFKADGGFSGKAFQARALIQRECRAQRLQGEGAVHGARFQVQQAKMPGQMAGNGALSRACRAVNGDDDLPAGFRGAQGAFVRTHPRFFVPCLGRAVIAKPLAVR